MFTDECGLDKAILDNDTALVGELLSRSSSGMLSGMLRLLRPREPERNSMLHLAAYSNSSDVAAMLIERGECVNRANSVGDTPTHIAARANAWETADVLVSFGADISAVNRAGQTPLDVAVASGNHRVAELLRLAARLSPRN